MSDYSHPSYNRAATTNTTASSHKHNIPPSNPASQQQNTRPPYTNSMLNSISSDVYGSPNSQIPYQQPPLNSHHNGSFQLNPNAPPFHPSYSYHLHDIPSYVNAPMYDGYCPANAYDYQFSQEIPMFTPYMEPPAANGDDAETLGAELGYANNFGYYGLQANLSPALCERMLCSERAKELQEIQVGLEQLILEPGEFETWSNAIRERTTNPSFKIDALKIAVEMIIQLAAFTSSSQTVQYNLAKLCSFLCHDLQTFQDDMIASLLSFHEEQRSNLSDQQRKNLLLFFAEIYDKLESKKSSQMQAFENALLDQIKEVLVADRLDDSKVKVVVEVLKLTGRYLDIDEGTSKINEILTQLNAIAKAHPAISDSVKERILSLNTWRENKWDARNFPANKEGKLTTDQGRRENDQGLTPSCSSSFIIGPDGQPLTEEERAFLEESFRKLDNNDTMLDNDDVSDEYDEFLSAVANEEAKKRVAEMEMAEMEKQMAKTSLDGRGEISSNRSENGKGTAKERGNGKN
ncbi:Uncharacterized protein BM_BM9740 [Brugia malayi]|nr:Uncharacterized protein BM_BM9740 [Brugia malayi]VIO93594.1 Uncharacterized protein BM_BM9740 [Brugia malayi]